MKNEKNNSALIQCLMIGSGSGFITFKVSEIQGLTFFLRKHFLGVHLESKWPPTAILVKIVEPSHDASVYQI